MVERVLPNAHHSTEAASAPFHKAAFRALFAASLVAAIAMQGCKPVDSTDVLGLTTADKRLAEPVDTEILRKNAETAADAYLSTQVDALKEFSKGPYTLAIDYSHVARLRILGYRSSFYYFCWDLYLPYRFHTDSKGTYTLVVQVTDRTPGNKHDINKFRVLRITIIDDLGEVKKTIENNSR